MSAQKPIWPVHACGVLPGLVLSAVMQCLPVAGQTVRDSAGVRIAPRAQPPLRPPASRRSSVRIVSAAFRRSIIDQTGIIRQIVIGWDQGNTERIGNYVEQFVKESGAGI